MHTIETPSSKLDHAIPWARFVELIRAHHRFTLTSHVKPDCDALGSEVGFAAVLDELGKQVTIVNADAVPPHLKFVDPESRIRQLGVDVSPEVAADCDALIVLDTSAWIQLGAMADVLRRTRAAKLVLDHHVSEDDLGAESFKDPAAEATGRLVVEAADALGVALSSRIAAPLFTAIATDTGWFRFSSVTGETFRVASRLVDVGAVPAATYNALYERHTLARVQLMGRILARTTAELNGRLVHTVALRQDFDETGALPSDTEDLVNATLAVAGTEVAVFFSEQKTGVFKVSFRSRSGLDCARVAEQFAGGGHKAAAGATVSGTWPAVQGKVLDVVRAAMG